MICIHWTLISQSTDEKNEQALSLGGTITVGVDIYSTNRTIDRRDGFNYRIIGNPSFEYGQLNIPVGFSYGNYENGSRQSFNKIGISPEYRWAKLHLGYRNLTYSPLTLSNRTFLGVGVELDPGVLRIRAMYGRFQRPIELDLTSTGMDQYPAYRQTGYALSVGLGSKTTYVDLIFLQIQDDSSSIEIPETFSLYPKSNTVAGVTSKFKLSDRLSWNNDFAISALTKDQRAPKIDDSSERIVNDLVGTVKANLSTVLQKAIRSEVRYMGKEFSLGATYERVDPEYRSLGTYFFNNDLERFTIDPAIRLFDRKLRLNARFGLQRDDLKKSLAKSTTRTAAMLNAFYVPNNSWQLSVNYSNLNSRQQIERAVMSDTIQMAYVSQNSSMNLTRLFSNTRLEQKIKLRLGFSAMQNDNEERVDTKAFRVGIGYTLKLKPIKLSLSPEFMVYLFDNELIDRTNVRYSLRLSKSLLEKKIRISLNNSIINNSLNGNSSSRTLQSFIMSTYRLNKTHTLGLRYRILSIMSIDPSGTDVYEGIGGLFYRVNLSQLN